MSRAVAYPFSFRVCVQRGDDDAPSAKRQRPDKLIDDIAEDEDDPDASDEDFDINNPDDIDDTADLIADDDETDPSQPRRAGKARMPRGATIEEDDTMHLTLDQRREQEEAERLVKELDERYGGEDGADDIDLNELDDYDEYDMEAGGGGGVAIPSIKDPKLWLIRCDPGTEDLMCLSLLQRFVNKQGSDDPLFIHSAFTTPASKGYIYIEADKEVHVKRAIRGLRAIKWPVNTHTHVHTTQTTTRHVPRSLTLSPLTPLVCMLLQVEDAAAAHHTDGQRGQVHR